VKADIENPAFVKAVLDGLSGDDTFAERILPPRANYGDGRNGADLRRLLVADQSLYGATFDLSQDHPSLMYQPQTPEGRRRGAPVSCQLQLSGSDLDRPRRVIAKVEWHPGELYPRVGFIVTNMSRPAENVVAFYNKRGTCAQWIKEGKGVIKWTRLSCRTFAANAVRLQLHALAYNLGNFLRTLATPEPIRDWSLTSLKEKLIKIGAKVVSHGRYIAFQMAEVAIPRGLFADILRLIAALRPPPDPAPA